jgi:hypothetical protein
MREDKLIRNIGIKTKRKGDKIGMGYIKSAVNVHNNQQHAPERITQSLNCCLGEVRK